MASRNVTRRRRRLAAGMIATGAVAFAISGCEEQPEGIETVTIDGRAFHLELAADMQSRYQGLSGRTEIAEDGGMLFVFPRQEVRGFVMRDCPIPIDIIFLDGSGRVTATHMMKVEPPRDPAAGEGEPGETNEIYDRRLKGYSSTFAAQFVIELAGGTLEEITVEEGDKIKLDYERLKRLAK